METKEDVITRDRKTFRVDDRVRFWGGKKGNIMYFRIQPDIARRHEIQSFQPWYIDADPTITFARVRMDAGYEIDIALEDIEDKVVNCQSN